jgi:predicted RNA methylase
MPMEKFRTALRVAGVETDMAQVECLLANMIYKVGHDNVAVFTANDT